MPMMLENRGPAPQLPAPTTLSLAALRVPERPAFGIWWLIAGFLIAGAIIAFVIYRPYHLAGARPHASESPSESPIAITRQLQAERPASIDVTLTLQTVPPGASIYLDGMPVGITPVETRVLRGAHQLAILGEGYLLVRETVVVGSDPINLHRELTAVPETDELAGLKVRCRTAGMRIFVDGADSGRACPNEARINTTPGEHFLQLYHPESDQMIEARRVNLVVRNRSARYYIDY
jgi:hypothetical protein